MRLMRHRFNAALVILVGLAILVLSLANPPGAVAEAASGTYQFGHFLLYFFLASALLLYFHGTPRGRVEAVLAAGVFGLGIELVQFALPFRMFSPADVMVNFLGASLVLLDHQSVAVTAVIEKEDELIEQYLL